LLINSVELENLLSEFTIIQTMFIEFIIQFFFTHLGNSTERHLRKADRPCPNGDPRKLLRERAQFQ